MEQKTEVQVLRDMLKSTKVMLKVKNKESARDFMKMRNLKELYKGEKVKYKELKRISRK